MKWCLLSLLLLSTSANAFELVEMTFDAKVENASLVMIGTVEQVEPRNPRRLTFAQIKVDSLLKGAAPKTICVQTNHSNPEESFVVAVGRRYLFLLNKHQDCYVSVNGHFAVIAVDGKD